MTFFGIPYSTFRSVIHREALTTRHNRFVQVFALVVLAGIGAIVVLLDHAAAVPFGVLLLFLYVVPLFGVLTGVSAAHEEQDEMALLLSQPVPRRAYVLGKALVLSLSLTAVLAAGLIPAAVAAPALESMMILGGLGVALILVSVSGGLAIGQHTTTRARGLMAALLAWFGAFAFYDIVALALTSFEPVRETPALWTALLLLNPIDAVRLTGLFSLERVPFAEAGMDEWMGLLANWLPSWVAVLVIGWTAGLLWSACRRIERAGL